MNNFRLEMQNFSSPKIFFSNFSQKGKQYLNKLVSFEIFERHAFPVIAYGTQKRENRRKTMKNIDTYFQF